MILQGWQVMLADPQGGCNSPQHTEDESTAPQMLWQAKPYLLDMQQAPSLPMRLQTSKPCSTCGMGEINRLRGRVA